LRTSSKKMALGSLVGAITVVLLASCGKPAPAPEQQESESPAAPLVSYERPPANPLKNAYFGETHLHTGYSLDANLFGTDHDPRTAYRFAMGEKVWLPKSRAYQRLRTPLDFAAVTDHAETLGTFGQCHNPNSENYGSLSCYGLRFKLKLMFKQLMSSAQQEGQETGRYNESVCGEDGRHCKSAAREIWQKIQQAANDYYQPGKFTTFIGFEYSPTLDSAGMLHRNVLFRSSQVPDNVFSAYDGFPEDLLRWLDTRCQGDCQALAIPHNPNFSRGLMFGDANTDATPLTRENLALRARLEPLMEVFQAKGNSECALGVGNNDEECGFENLWPPCSEEQAQVDPRTGQHAPRCIGPNDTTRQTLKKGLQEEKMWGFNPYKFGLVAATDNHNATPGDTVESTWNGHGGEPDASPEYRLGEKSSLVTKTLGFAVTALNPGGLAGVWAEENTREAIFDAMQRKETFATSGSRIRVRLFASFDFDPQLHQRSDRILTAYGQGVPMGGDLVVTPDQLSSHNTASKKVAPYLLVMAQRDAHSAPLQKIQIIKGWTEKGEAREQVYDVACAEDLQPDPATHRCPDLAPGVDISDCSLDQTKGAAELSTTWSDPDFDTEQPAFYYARVLEMPSCRWSQYDANRLGVPHPDAFPATIRERAWSSPIWYSPRVPRNKQQAITTHTQSGE